jgi:hypothetical protein
MAALEFAKFHAHAMKSSPNKADERTARALRALELPQRAILLSCGNRGRRARGSRTDHAHLALQRWSRVVDPARPIRRAAPEERAAPTADGTSRGAEVVRSANCPEQRCSACRAGCRTIRRVACQTDFGIPSCPRFGIWLGGAQTATPRDSRPPARRLTALAQAEARARPNQPPSPNEERLDRVVGSVSLVNF